ncbi:hypothetical protein OIU76_011584 [Salix suchowensis]|nr:hypothetical protein OIU76_011584 [Salix suchowensis]KAJ6356715.1 hypothetical protein OIU78_004752 [Salix suchowensis]
MRIEHKIHLSQSTIHHHRSVLVLQPLDALIQLLDLHNKMSNRVKQPVENECSTYQQGIPLALHDGFLMSEVLGWGTGITLAARHRLVLPVYVHQQKQAKRNHRHERLQQITCHRNQPLAQSVKTRDCQEKDHDCLSACGVA